MRILIVGPNPKSIAEFRARYLEKFNDPEDTVETAVTYYPVANKYYDQAHILPGTSRTTMDAVVVAVRNSKCIPSILIWSTTKFVGQNRGGHTNYVRDERLIAEEELKKEPPENTRYALVYKSAFCYTAESISKARIVNTYTDNFWETHLGGRE